MCDVKTGFFQDIIVYTESTTDIQHYEGLWVSASTVMTRLAPHLGKGHVDNVVQQSHTLPASALQQHKGLWHSQVEQEGDTGIRMQEDAERGGGAQGEQSTAGSKVA